MKKTTLLLILLCLSLSINAQTYLTENFDTTIPATWSIDDAGGATGDSWATGQINGTSLDGTNAAFVDSDANGNGTLLLETLTSPAFDTTGATALFLDFQQFYNNIGADSANVEVWDGTAWINVLSQNANAGSFANPDQQKINITAYSNAAMQVRFIYDDADVWAWYWMIDNVSVYNETCPSPTDLTFISSTSNSANLSWNLGGAETDWEVAIQPQGTGVPIGSGAPTTTNNPYVDNTLAPATNYEAYVRADCGGDFSFWIGPINFATECVTIAAPHSEGFENGGAIPLCWTMSGDEDWLFSNTAAGNHIGNNGVITGTTLTNGFFAWVDSSGAQGSATLTSPFIDVSTLTTPALSFYEISNNETNANSTLEVEVWDGAAWNAMAIYNTNTNGWEQKVINLSTLTITGDIQARFIFSETVTGDFYDDIAIDDVTFDELPSCVNPSNFVVESTTSTTANLAWDSNGNETAWEVAVQAPGTGTPAGAGDPAANNAPYVAMNLTPSTTYEAYVRSDCGGGDFSDWLGPITFITECATFVAPYTEGFENGGVIPICWTMSGDEDWLFSNTAAGNHIGNNGVITGTTLTNGFFAWVDSSGAQGSATLTSPLIDVSTLTTPALSFYEISNNETNANSTLEVEVWDGAAWNAMAIYNTNTNGWEQKVINLSTLTITGDIQARFIFSETVTGDFYDDIAIDDVTFDELPSCVNPSNFVVESTTSTTANLAWDSNGNETAWEVAVQAPGTGTPAGAGDPAANNAPYVAMNLTPSTTYEAYVRSDCGGGDFSDWLGPITFITECATFVAPYTEGFENGGVIPICWTMSGDEDWLFSNTAAGNHIGNNGVITGTTLTNGFFAWVDSSGAQGSATLTSPFIDVSTLTSPALSFYEISNNETNANSTLEVEVWDGAAWNPMAIYNTNTNGWELKIINLSSLTITGDVQARFIFSETVTGDFYDDIAIDDVTFDEVPACLFPSDITTSNITETSVEVSWLPGNTETAWEYVIQPSGTGVPAAGGTPTTNTTVTDNTLTAGTAYEIYIRSDCSASGDGYSDWVGPIVFSTLPSNDECDDAIMFLANSDGNCTNFISGSIFGATQSPQTNPCPGNANNDVWFSFTAVSTDHAVSLNNITGSTTLLAFGVYEGADCNTLTNIACSAGNQTIVNGLTVGTTYYIRVYSNSNNTETSTFDLCVISIPPPITVNVTQYTIAELVEDILINSPCSAVSNITSSTGTDFNSDNGIGYFEANGSGFPFESGIIMTTGNALNAPGPESGALNDGDFNWPGDADLEAVINEGPTNNASIIEFDFVPLIEEMSFQFIFAAEEYGTFQCGFSDAFAFLLTDTVTGATTNLAVIPGTTTPVSVFTIRDMAFNGNCPSANPNLFAAYYGPGGLPAETSPTNFLGRTVPLAAEATVVPNRTYHIKLVIADDGDTSFDSAVFLEAGSFVIGEADLGDDITLESGNANCEGDEIILDIGIDVADNTTITWYTLEDGIQEPVLDENGAPENGPTLAVTETNTYIVEIVLNTNASCFIVDQILVQFFPNPVFPDTLPDILGCDIDNSGQAVFDITQNETLIIDNQTDVSVTYYETMVDAEDATNVITNPTTYTSSPPTTIYYRIENDTTSCAKTSSFELALADKPTLVQADSLFGCDSDADAIANYDLTANEAVIANGQTGLVFTYHTTLADAETSSNAIADPVDYDSAPATIFVRVENAGGCFETTTFDLELADKPVLVQSGPAYGCDDGVGNNAIFDLTTNEDVIANGQAGLTFSYYTSQADAETSSNAIADPTNYDSTLITIFVRAENAEGCFEVTTFELEFADKPTLVQSGPVLGCDDDDDGISTYDLTSNEAEIANGQTGFTFTYHDSVADAETSTNAIANPANFTGVPQVVYVRVENVEGCFEVTSFDLEFGIAPMTSFDSSIVYEVCPNTASPITVTATGDNYSEDQVSITWYYEGDLISGQTDLTLDNVVTAGTYSIVVMFNDGCTADPEYIEVEESETCIIPQGISPNGDGLNETFDLSSFDVQKLTIFNRNGIKVYEKTNYTNEWHGQSLDGDELPVGTYYYVMNYQGNKTKATWVYLNRENN